MNIITFYLPQFHTFPENDEWWGRGFTEWTNTKKARPLFEGHYQPHTPLNNNYYDLSNPQTLYDQIKIAKEYGIYGFCFYHYWFSGGKMLMQKPLEMFLKDKEMAMKFCLSWANESWTRAWDGAKSGKQILMQQEYGDKSDWEKHFDYLMSYFEDERYILIDEKPLIIIYRPEIIPCFEEMMECWRKRAINSGIKGLYIIAQGSKYCMKMHRKQKDKVLDGYIMYEPGYTYSSVGKYGVSDTIKNYCEYRQFLSTYLPIKIKSVLSNILHRENIEPQDVIEFSKVWESIIQQKIPENYYPGAFANWDNSARRGKDGRIIAGSSPELFEYYFKKLVEKTREASKDYIFFTAWNEWAEGSHLEPDEKYKYAYLEAIKRVLEEEQEFPDI